MWLESWSGVSGTVHCYCSRYSLYHLTLDALSALVAVLAEKDMVVGIDAQCLTKAVCVQIRLGCPYAMEVLSVYRTMNRVRLVQLLTAHTIFSKKVELCYADYCRTMSELSFWPHH